MMLRIGDTISKAKVDKYEARKLEEAVRKLNAEWKLRKPTDKLRRPVKEA